MTDIITKAKIIEAVEELPENATVEDAIEKLVFLHKVQIGLTQVTNGETIPLKEVEQFLKKRRETTGDV